MAIVTIARLAGSGGDVVAAKVAESLGYDLIDSSLIARVAEIAGVSAEQVMNLDEKVESRTLEWLREFITPKIGKIILEEERHLKPKNYIEDLREVIRNLVERDNIIFVGRGIQFILEGRDNLFRIRIVADIETRIDRLSRFLALTQEEAWDRIHRSDAMRKSFIQRYFGADWDDPHAYDLILNTSKLTVEESSELIVSAIRAFGKRVDYIPGVRDRRKVEQRKENRRKGSRSEEPTGKSPYKDIRATVLKNGRQVRIDRRKKERRKNDRRRAPLKEINRDDS